MNALIKKVGAQDENRKYSAILSGVVDNVAFYKRIGRFSDKWLDDPTFLREAVIADL